jgi:SAM-dependent methyltransferase
LNNFLRAARDTVRGLGELSRLRRSREQLEFVTREVARINARLRRDAWHEHRPTRLETQTKASFEFQWQHMPAGAALPTDAAFMREVAGELPAMVGAAREWFAGKRVADIGCGVGRYSYGLLQLGAVVTACDQSEAGLARTGQLCAAFADRLTLMRIDLLEWNEVASFDLAFSYGVVHHTGNTYLAVENVCRKVAVGGRVFFMIYAFPDNAAALEEINLYERLAEQTRDMSFAARKDFVTRRFGEHKAHGWFDAISPRINDRLTFEEIHDLLTELGFGQIEGRRVLRNHYVTAQRLRTA